MFNPKLELDLKLIWDRLGTFFAKMDPNGKAVVEKFWTALYEGLEGLYYDLYQANLSTYLDTSEGFIEEAYQKYEVIWQGPGTNVETIDLPKYLEDQGAGEWNGIALGGTLGGYYDLPDKGLYLSVPSLSGLTSNQVLYEGVDYVIHNYKQIKFLKKPTQYTGYDGPGSNTGPEDVKILSSGINLNVHELPTRVTETFLSKTGIVLLPTLSNFLIPAFGQTAPEVLLASGFYPPFTSGFRSDTLTYFDKQKDYARHLTKFCQALLNYFKKVPSIHNLEKLYSLIQGFPFVYKDGVVDSVRFGDTYDYIAIRSIANSVDYMAAGASWSNDTVINVQGNYLFISNPRGYLSGSTPGGAIVTPQNFWIPIKPLESDLVQSEITGVVGVTLTGIPWRTTSETGFNGGEWHETKFGNPAISRDVSSGVVGTDGEYHYTANPKGTYIHSETQHSPLLGYALDGYPIYGPMGYTNVDGSGGIKRHSSSYVLISGVREDADDIPSGSYDGKYLKDYKYDDSAGDLDEFNGIWSSTPEYPDGIYHYVCSTDESNSPVFPYVIRKFRGVPNYGKGLLKNKSIDNLTEEVLVYEIPTGGHYLCKEGDPVKKFDIMLSGITMYDYIMDGDVISGIIRASGTTQQYDVEVITDFDGNKGFNIGTLSESIFFSGGVLKNADVSTVADEGQGAGAYSESEGDSY